MMHRRRWVTLAGLLVIAVLSALDHAGLFGYQSTDRERYSKAEATVVSVTPDGLLNVNIPDGHEPATRVRLLGIAYQSVEDGGTAPDDSAEEAVDFLRHNIIGKRIQLALDPHRRTRDRERWLLAYVYLVESNDMLNELLIERGLALADRRVEHVCKLQFTEKEKRASRANADSRKRP